MKEELERLVTKNRQNCFLLIWQLPAKLGWDVSKDTICTGLKVLGFYKRSAREKRFPTDNHRKARLDWVNDRLDLTREN